MMPCSAAMSKKAKNDKKTTPQKNLQNIALSWTFPIGLAFQTSFTKTLSNKHTGTEDTKVLLKT